MPRLALFLEGLANKLFMWLAVRFGMNVAIKMTVLIALATMYVGGLTTFNALVQPFLTALFATGFGMVIGLAFPPIAGTVMSGLIALWLGTLTYRYFHQFGMMLISK